MKIRYPEIGICGLSCRLCPNYHMETASRCGGCKSEARIAAGCPFITCAVKKRGIEFCWDCDEHVACEKWRRHREAGKKFDSFKCYQTLEADIALIQQDGVRAFESLQKTREELLGTMLREFNEGRSKRYYCVASTVLGIPELRGVLDAAGNRAKDLDIKERAKLLHSLLDGIARERHYCLKLRRP